MKLKFGAPRERSSSNESDEPRDPSKRRTLKLGVAVLATSLAGSSRESVPQPLGTFAERFHAGEQLKMNGITDFQRQAYKPGISEALASGVEPFFYSETTEANYGKKSHTWFLAPRHDVLLEIDRVKNAFIHGNLTPEDQVKRLTERIKEIFSVVLPVDKAREIVNARTDAWRMYLGLPQLHNTFSISAFKPKAASRNVYYYKINGFLERQMQGIAEEKDGDDERTMYSMTKQEILKSLVAHAFQIDKSAPPLGGFETDFSGGVMGHYTLTKGEDEQGTYLSYYDRWDLDGSLEGEKGIIGKPYEIYDRIYYNPKTFEVVEPAVVTAENQNSVKST